VTEYLEAAELSLIVWNYFTRRSDIGGCNRLRGGHRQRRTVLACTWRVNEKREETAPVTLITAIGAVGVDVNWKEQTQTVNKATWGKARICCSNMPES
jgi:hypothetical protein